MNQQRLLVIYASVHGQAESIALRIAETAGLETVIRDIDHADAEDLETCDSVIIVASVRFGKHARRVRRFVKENRKRLAELRTAFVSVSGSAGDPATHADAKSYVELFEKETGWMPREVQLVAGAAKFTQYNPLVRWITKRAFESRGVKVDTHRDYEFTDWNAVEQFARTFAAPAKGMA